jgi:hypothetical protein
VPAGQTPTWRSSLPPEPTRLEVLTATRAHARLQVDTHLEVLTATGAHARRRSPSDPPSPSPATSSSRLLAASAKFHCQVSLPRLLPLSSPPPHLRVMHVLKFFATRSGSELARYEFRNANRVRLFACCSLCTAIHPVPEHLVTPYGLAPLLWSTKQAKKYL